MVDVQAILHHALMHGLGERRGCQFPPLAEADDNRAMQNAQGFLDLIGRGQHNSNRARLSRIPTQMVPLGKCVPDENVYLTLCPGNGIPLVMTEHNGTAGVIEISMQYGDAECVRCWFHSAPFLIT